MNEPQRMHFEKNDKYTGHLPCFDKIQNTTIARFDIKMNNRRSCSGKLIF